MAADLRIVLVRPRNPLNIGAAARAMANFGFSGLWLVAPYGEAWRAARSARGGGAVLAGARAVPTLLEAVADCDYVVGTTAGSARRPGLPLEPWPAVAAALRARPGRAALLFGSEKTGLGVEEISFCTRLARIPTQPRAASMNLGQAVAVCCYELAHGPAGGAGALGPAAAPDAEIDAAGRERIVAAWAPLLEAMGVVRPQHRAGQTRRLRAMLIRWRLGGSDARRLLGIARELRRFLHAAGDVH